MSSTAADTNRQAGVVADASEQTPENMQTVASATEELTTSIAEIGRQVVQNSVRALENRAPDQRHGAIARHGRPEDRRCRDIDSRHCRTEAGCVPTAFIASFRFHLQPLKPAKYISS